ncbi:MAG: MotA/TolQ/ExbB proton channel family protein, partial [Paludibacteraceae bacterium]|nr:MotA/TolQ/ExbB proton channel family protein [Paludibacteraceae bacterium]
MLLQIDTLALVEEQLVQVTEPVSTTMRYLTMAAYGGWIMVILAILLAGACYIFIERLVVLKQATREDKSFMDRIRDYIHDGKIDSALNLCKQTDTPSAHMIEKGITRIGRPMQDVQVAVENVGNL